MACREATAWQANDEHARTGAARVGGNAAMVRAGLALLARAGRANDQLRSRTRYFVVVAGAEKFSCAKQAALLKWRIVNGRFPHLQTNQ
jgi:hypothetical protein